MSVCTFIASDFPLKEVAPVRDYPLEINLDDGEMYDGDADDNYSLLSFTDVWEYTDKKYGVHLEWNYCTAGRAKQLIEYLKNALQDADSVEIDRSDVWNTPDKTHPNRPSFYCLEIRRR